MYATEFLDIPPLTGAGGTVVLPGSKSISNRVLLLAALGQGATTVTGLLDSDDTRVMFDAIEALGCAVRRVGPDRVVITGLDGRTPAKPLKLFLGNAGTAMRPLAAALAVMGGDFELSGTARMHERPIGDLVDALRQLGCRIDYLGAEGFPPLRIGQPLLSLNQPIQVRGDVSSQFLTALLMALPLMAQDKAPTLATDMPDGGRSAAREDGLRGSFGSQVGTEDFFDLAFQQARFLVGREPYSHALGPVGGGAGRGDPGHLAGHRIALRVFRQGQQHVHIVSQLVLARGGNEDAAIGEQRDVGGMQGRLFLDGQLDDTWAGCGG